MLIGRYSAFLDANVLHPAFLRAALLWFADDRLLRPVWSKHVLGEWRSSLKTRHPDLTDEKLDRLQAFVGQFPDAEVTGYEPFIEGLTLPDAGDRHVLAAAIVGRCNGIVTKNVRDFPDAIAGAFGLEIVHPDDFVVNMIDLDESRALEVARRHREAMVQSNPTPDEYLAKFERCGLAKTANRLRNHKDCL